MTKEKLRKLLRTAQTYFPFLESAKFILVKFVRKSLNMPFEKDFRALKLFPDIENALYLDVGSNRGEAINAIQAGVKNARIVAFEPNEFLSKKLEQRFRGSRKVSIKNFGLGNKTEVQTLYVPSYRGWVFSGLASFYKEHVRNWLCNRLYFYNDKHLKLQQLKCKLVKLDDLKLKPFFIKLDIQGYEYQAIRGGGETLAHHKPILLVEAPDDQTKDFLKRFGYRMYAYEDNSFVKNHEGSLNTFFIVDEKFLLLKH